MSEEDVGGADDIDREAPLTLSAAAERAFPDGTMTVRTLRAERDRGRLETWIIGKREYTSLDAIAKMIELCRAAPRTRVSTSAHDNGARPSKSSSTEAPEPQPGAALRSLERLRERLDQKKQAQAGSQSVSSSTEDANIALALARASAKRLRERSRAKSKKPGSKQSGTATGRK